MIKWILKKTPITIEILGKIYQLRERKSESSPSNKRISTIMATAMILTTPYSNPMSGIKIPELKLSKGETLESEFEKIQLKKSTLSRSERDRVEFHFNYKWDLIK